MTTNFKSEEQQINEFFYDRDFDSSVYLFATFLGLYFDKENNPIVFTTILFRNPILLKFLCEIHGYEFYELIQKLSHMFPLIGKSKKLINVINELGINRAEDV